MQAPKAETLEFPEVHESDLGGTRWNATAHEVEVTPQHLDNLILTALILGIVLIIAIALRTNERKPRVIRRSRTDKMDELGLEMRSNLLGSGDGDEEQTVWEKVIPPSNFIMPNILAGAIVGMKFTLAMVLFSDIIYNNEESKFLENGFPVGINMNLMSCSTSVVMSAITSGFNVLVAPQDIPAIILGQIAHIMKDTVQAPNMLPNTVLACAWINTLIFGALAWLAGRFSVGTLMRSIPTPVLGGFIAATGASAARNALQKLCMTSFHILWPTSLATFQEFGTWVHIAAGLFSFVCIRFLGGWIKNSGCIKNAHAKALVGPLCLLLPIVLFYAYLLLAGHVRDQSQAEQMDNLRENAWFTSMFKSRPAYMFWSDTFPKDHFEKVAWPALLNGDVLLLMAMLQALSLLSAVLNIIGASSQIAGGEAVDLDTELKTLGLQNLIIGALGGNICYHQLGTSVNMHMDGGTHRLAPLAGGVFIGIVFVTGLPVSPYIPQFFLGGVFLNLGFAFIKMHLIDKFRKMDWASYLTMCVIVLMALFKDMTWAVGLGLALQVVTLVLLSSSVDPVTLHQSTDTVSSSRLRSIHDRRLLASSHLIEVVHLHGPLFFGVTPRLVSTVEKIVKQNNPKPQQVVIGLSQVTAMDDSALQALTQLQKVAAKQGTEICLVGAHQWKWLLTRHGIIADKHQEEEDAEMGSDPSVSLSVNLYKEATCRPLPPWSCGFVQLSSTLSREMQGHVQAQVTGSGPCRWFHNLDSALLDCEERVLLALRRSDVGGLKEEPNGMFVDRAIDIPEDGWMKLLAEGETLKIPYGEVVFARGQAASDVYVLTAGSLKVTDVSGPQYIHALAMLGTKERVLQLQRHTQTAEVTSKDGAEVVALSQDALVRLREEKPELYISFSEVLAQSLCTGWGQ